MRSLARLASFAFAATLCAAQDPLSIVRSNLQQLKVDSTQTWRVRELELSLGGVKIYLSEGVLAFATPVNGQRIAAVYTTAPVEAGDAEIIALPPLSAERASLARFTHSPNLDEHFTSALLFFGNSTAESLLEQIHQHPLHPAPDLAPSLAATFDDALRQSASEIDVRITQSILDRHIPANSFFYGMLSGRSLGPFDVILQPGQPDPVLLGRLAHNSTQQSYFQIWSAFRSKSASQPAPADHISDYRLDTTIHPDLSMSSVADFDYQADSDDGAVINLFLTPRLRVTSATIDGRPASVLVHDSPRAEDIRGATTFLLVNATPLAPGSHHQVQVHYEGTVIRRTSEGALFVDDRNAWYPFLSPMLTVFDLTFHCPENLRLVSTGDPIAEEVSNGQRLVHRRTARAQSLAGFNLGEFDTSISDHPPYRIEICSSRHAALAPDLAEQTSRILQYFTSLWMPLSGNSLSVTPIDGYFGQGFPGLIYLSSISYMREQDRPANLRNATFDAFFTQLLLPHELAHQWWGNIVTPTDYHSNWIVEAMSNYAALQYVEQTRGRPDMDAILAQYRADLIKPRANNELIDANGPVTFDQRLLSNFGTAAWHDILYEKGTWIFHMLRQRMGAQAFHAFQLQILKTFSNRPISNEDLRQQATRFIPPDQPDPQLTAFFDTWIYDTGIPTLELRNGNLRLSEVPDSYTVDVPLNCSLPTPKWFRATIGVSNLPARNCSLPSATNFLYRE